MKRLVLLAVLALMLAGQAMALSLTLQKPGDLNYITYDPSHFVENTTGGNSYLYVGAPTSVIKNKNPQQTNYMACNYAGGGGTNTIIGYDSDGATQLFAGFGGNDVVRNEVVISASGDVTIYKNGIVSDTRITAKYPYYISYSRYCDDYIYGSNENRYIFSMPDYSKYEIVKDINNPASSGFAFINGTIIASNSMTTTWGRSNLSAWSLDNNESIIMRDMATQTVYQTKYTDTRSFGTEYWNLSGALFESSAPYGLYEITIPTSGKTSDPIVYTSIGGTITFDKPAYTTGDTANVTYTLTAAYKGLGTYRIDTMDVYGNVIDTQPVQGNDGESIDVAFSSTDSVGVYYTVLIVTIAGEDVWLAVDYAELNGYVMFEGWPNGAETEAPIAAHINISQGSTIFDYDTVVGDGYQYNTSMPSATAFLAGTALTTNITAPGYRQYTYTFTPMLAKTVDLNFTLVPLLPAYDVGLAFGGVARETTYGRPIPLVLVAVMNSTHSEYYSTTGNSVGYYLCDYGASCHLTLDRNYQIWGSKTNYANSSIYNATAVGAI